MGLTFKKRERKRWSYSSERKGGKEKQEIETETNRKASIFSENTNTVLIKTRFMGPKGQEKDRNIHLHQLRHIIAKIYSTGTKCCCTTRLSGKLTGASARCPCLWGWDFLLKTRLKPPFQSRTTFTNTKSIMLYHHPLLHILQSKSYLLQNTLSLPMIPCQQISGNFSGKNSGKFSKIISNNSGKRSFHWVWSINSSDRWKTTTQMLPAEIQ